MIKKLVVLAVIASAIIIGIITSKGAPVYASPGQNSACTSCHSQSSSLNVTTPQTAMTVSTGQSFSVSISWTGSSGRTEINWPNVVSNTLFSPTPRVPYSSSAASGTTTSTLTAPATAGNYTVRVFAARGSPRDSDFVNIVVTVNATNAAPVLATIGNKSVSAGQPLQFTVSATDANGGTLTYSATGLPTGATFTAATRTFSWTPTSSQAGTYNVTFQVSDGSLTDSELITITVVVGNAAPSFSPIGNKSTVAGRLLQFTVSATDPNNDALTYSTTGLPSGATFTAAARTFSWTPTSSQAGTYNVTFQVSDGSLTDSELITITVTATNVAPVLAAIGNKTVVAGQVLQFTVTATDLNNDLLTYSASNLPSGAVFASDTRIFSWTPMTSQTGPFSNITFEVTDGIATDSEVIVITVNTPNLAPVITPIGGKSVDVGQLLQFSIWATDANYDTLSYSASNLPAGAVFNSATRILTWTPTPGQTGTYSGVSFQVSDGLVIATENITITVREINVAPVLNPIGNKVISAGQSLQFNLSATDSNNNALNFSIFNPPLGTNFSTNTGTFVWTPTSEQVGTYPNVTFWVSDGSLTDTESITITVTSPNLPPVLSAIGDKNVTAGETLKFTVSATDPNKDQMTFTAVGLPSGATFNPATQTFLWSPTGNQAGSHSGIKFSVSDGTLAASESISITIAPLDVNPPKLVEATIVSKFDPTSVIIRWTTDEPSTSQVEYWASPRVLTPLDTKLITNHEVELTDLKPGTEYTYVTLSRDRTGNLLVSKENNFSTAPAVSYSGLKIEPVDPLIGQEVKVSVVVTNNLKSIINQVVPFRVGGALESTKTIDLAPGEKKEVSFFTTRWAIGLSQIDISEIKGYFIVRDLAGKQSSAFSPLSLSIIGALIGIGAFAFWYYRRKTLKT